MLKQPSIYYCMALSFTLESVPGTQMRHLCIQADGMQFVQHAESGLKNIQASICFLGRFPARCDQGIQAELVQCIRREGQGCIHDLQKNHEIQQSKEYPLFK